MTLAAIFFDLDGTLLDTAPEFTHCLNQLLAQEGKEPISLAYLRTAVSLGATGMIERAFAISSTHPQFAELKQKFLDLYHSNLGLKTTFFPGIISLLEKLSHQSIRWGIITNKPTLYTLPLIEKFKPLNAAACVIAGDTLTTQKPHPAPLLHACELLKVAPDQCWYVGDAKTDVEASKAAGMRCAVAHYGYISPEEKVETWKADRYLNHAEDLLKLF